MRPTTLALSLALLGLATLPVTAAVGNTHRPSSLPWSDAVQVASFDPAVGQLIGVRLSIDAFVRADLAAENQAEVPDLVHVQTLANVRVALPNGEVVTELSFDASATWSLAAFDGKTDFAGPSGRTIRPAGRRHAEVLIDDPAVLLYFQGPASGGGTVELPVSASGVTSIVGGSKLAQLANQTAGVRVLVEYFAVP